MWLVAGLGNPGAQYSLTRHNIGFMVLDSFLRSVQAPAPKSDFQSKVWKLKLDHEEVLFLMPQTFMNNSGQAVQPALQFYKIPVENLIVLHDEIDQPFGKLKIQKNRGHGGHNGIRDISEKLGTNDYLRIRMGIGRPPHPEMAVPDYVLQKFSESEMNQLPDFFQTTIDAMESIIFDGHQKASTKFNT